MKACSLRRGCSTASMSAPLRSGGRALDESVRGRFEPRFGFDFSRVRIHTGDEAAASARHFGARAYTAGDHLVFDSGEYSPHTAKGARLLAHELTHVVQQRNASILGEIEAADSGAEREADTLSTAAAAGRDAQPNAKTSAGVMRQVRPGLLPGPKPGIVLASSGTNESGGSCTRTYVPLTATAGGRVTWSGVSQKVLDENVRIIPEEGVKSAMQAFAGAEQGLDAVYFGKDYGHFVLKVPDHCSVFMRGLSTTPAFCCNAAAFAFKGGPREATAAEFGVLNNWDMPIPTLQVPPNDKPLRLEPQQLKQDKTIVVPRGGQR